MPHLVVVGAGITGLSAAYFVRQWRPDVHVTVVEAAQRPGGKIDTTEVGGVAVDAGAESFLVTRPEARALVRDLGMADQLEPQARTGASLWTRSGMRQLPRGQVMGIPTDLRELAESGLLSPLGLLRIPVDRLLPPVRLGDDDVAVGDLVASRVGVEVLNQLVEPLLGGVYAGHARQLSLRATLPGLAALLRRGRGLLDAAEQVASRPRPDEPPFATLRGGLGGLITRLASEPGVTMRTGVAATALQRTATGWHLTLGSEQLTADAVLLAVPADATAQLIRGVAPYAAGEVAATEYASVALVTYVIPGAGRVPIHGTGFLVPPADGRYIKAATMSSQKWESIGASGATVIRCSIGRFGEDDDLARTDDEIARAAWAELADAVGGLARPIATRVTRWNAALPQYFVGHPMRVDRVRRALRGMPTLALAGAAFDGVGIPACIASAEAAARRVTAAIPAPDAAVPPSATMAP